MNSKPTHGKGDKPRPYNPHVWNDNFQEIKKPCGCKFGTKCQCKPLDNKPAQP